MKDINIFINSWNTRKKECRIKSTVISEVKEKIK